MLNTSARLLLASIAAGSIVTLSSASASAQDIVGAAYEFLDNATVNDYGSPCDINWVTYVGKTQGACFLTQLLKHTEGYADIDFSTIWGSVSPNSEKYYDAIVAQNRFVRINSVSAIQSGDVMVYDKTDMYAGHLMIFTGPATEITHQIAPIYAGTRQWKVSVIDSTQTAHGCTDTRFSGTCFPTMGSMDPGVGEGNIRLYTTLDPNVLLGSTWSVTKSNTSYYSPTTRPYAIGRLNNLPDPIVVDPPPPPPPAKPAE